jgi:hypothetical protein
LTAVFTAIQVVFILVYVGVARYTGLADIDNVLKVFGGISGVVAAAIYAQYFGRLQDKFFDAPSWLTSLLFVYTAIQSLFLFIGIKGWGIVLMDSALFFKSLLFLYMIFLFRSGRLLFYLMRTRRTYENAGRQFETFRSIINK